MIVNSQENTFPKVTIAILSWSRLHYLRATLESARKCILYPNIEWIVSDNASTEPGLKDYLESCEWLNRLIVRRQSHGQAMNQIVEEAEGELLLLWPDDVQFVVEGDWMVDIVELLLQNEWLGTLGLNYLRRITYQNLLTYRRWLNWRSFAKELFFFRRSFRTLKRVHSSRGLGIQSVGHTWPGICGSGIPSIARTVVWKAFAPWHTTQKRSASNIIDSSLGAETDMNQRFYKSGLPLQQGVLTVPVAVDIINDVYGSKAKVRGNNKRYGNYTPPSGSSYYQIFKQADFCEPKNLELPLAFEDCVKPLGFELPMDVKGNLIKANEINMDCVEELPE
jgi:glycosyltransferase involved in cell wall biosynthesis